MGSERRHRRPATTEQERENQLVSLAMDLAEKQLTEGTASSQVITHYLKLGSSREKLEQERLRYEAELMGEKIAMMAQAQRIEELYGQALAAMRTYAGQDPDPEEDDYYDDQDLR